MTHIIWHQEELRKLQEELKEKNGDMPKYKIDMIKQIKEAIKIHEQFEKNKK